MEYLNNLFENISLKCDRPLLCEFPILFSTLNVKLGHKFSQLSHKFGILDFEMLVWGCVYFQVIPNS